MAAPPVLTPLQGMVANTALDTGLNPALALSLAHWESGGFNPNAVSPTGVTGLLQVTNDTGAAYGQLPETRNDPQVSAWAGLRYFRDLLDQHNGDVVTALSRYNGGSDPQFAQHVLSVYPQYAHLASYSRDVPQQDQGQAIVAQAPAPQGDLSQRLDAIDAQILGKAPQPQAAPAAAPPQQGVPSGAVPGQAPAPTASAPQGDLSQRLDAIDAQILQGTPEARPTPGGFFGFLGGAAERQARQAGIEIPPGGQMPSPEMQQAAIEQYLKPTEQSIKQLGAGVIQTGATMGGAAVAGPIGAGLASYGAYRFNQAAGLTPGTPTVLPQTFEDYVQLVAPMVPAAVEGVGKGIARISRAGRAVTTAEEIDKEAMLAYAKDFRANTAAYQQKLRDLDTLGQERLRQAHLTADEATNDALRAWETKGQEAYDKALATAKTAQQDYHDLLTEQTAARTEQATAVAGVEGLPGRFAPTTSSRQLYRQFADVAGDKPVNLSPIRQELWGMQDSLPSTSRQFQRVAEEIQGLGQEEPVSRVHDILKEVGELTRASDSRTRGYASRLFGAFHDALDQSIPAEKSLLTQANATWKQERAVGELQNLIRVKEGGVLSQNERGETVLNVKALLNRINRPSVMDWLTPAQQDALRNDVKTFVGTPAMPKGGSPPPPDAAPLPGTMSMKGMERPTFDVAPLPGTMSMKGMDRPPLPQRNAPEPVEPTVSRKGLEIRAGLATTRIPLALLGGRVKEAAIEAGTLGADALSYAIAKGLVASPTMRENLLEWMHSGGSMSPKLYGYIGALVNEYNSQQRQDASDAGGYTPPQRSMPGGRQGGSTR